MKAALLLTACCALALPALAHDSWLVPAAGGLQLVTGDRYPVSETASTPAASGCMDAHGRKRALRLRGSVSCWATLAEHDIVLEDDKVAVYLREIRPPAALQERWAQQREAGLPWRERYSKYARIELAGVPAGPLGLPLEIVTSGGAFAVLAHGQPVAGLAVELVSERSRFGVWTVSDAQGRVNITPPFGGRWLLRATLLEPDGEGWRSRFVTLAFETK
jgi:hypothetical protein